MMHMVDEVSKLGVGRLETIPKLYLKNLFLTKLCSQP